MLISAGTIFTTFGARGKVRGPTKLQNTCTSVPNLIAIHPIVVEIFKNICHPHSGATGKIMGSSNSLGSSGNHECQNTIFHTNPSTSCWDTSATLLAWLKTHQCSSQLHFLYYNEHWHCSLFWLNLTYKSSQLYVSQITICLKGLYL